MTRSLLAVVSAVLPMLALALAVGIESRSEVSTETAGVQGNVDCDSPVDGADSLQILVYAE